MDVSGRHVVVTGAAGGIGEALARRFAKEGARAVVLADVDAERVHAVADSIGDVATAAEVDVRSRAAITKLVDEAEARSGAIELFCSNAGIGVAGTIEVAEEDWQRIWDINVMAHVHAAHVLVPRMVERGGGWLLNTASAAGLLAQIGSTPYTVTKAAAVAFAESLAIEYGDKGIGVSVLCPQAVRTNMTAGTEGGGVAGVDGMMEPETVADAVIVGLDVESFLILPHPEVRDYLQRKTANIDRWLKGMQRLRDRYAGNAI
jgi:NAD(P)-dependent dehydrogenase (short-subunit alcohol dehydrogenase family)